MEKAVEAETSNQNTPTKVDIQDTTTKTRGDGIIQDETNIECLNETTVGKIEEEIADENDSDRKTGDEEKSTTDNCSDTFSISDDLDGFYVNGAVPDQQIINGMKLCFSDLASQRRSISLKSLQNAYTSVGMEFEPEELEFLIETFDVGGKGKICFRDFVREMYNDYKEEGIQEEDIQFAFDSLDRSRDGLITWKVITDEFMRVDPHAKTEDILREFRDHMDFEGYGVLDYSQFRRYCIHTLHLDMDVDADVVIRERTERNLWDTVVVEEEAQPVTMKQNLHVFHF